jgi:hypothetical protein
MMWVVGVEVRGGGWLGGWVGGWVGGREGGREGRGVPKMLGTSFKFDKCATTARLGEAWLTGLPEEAFPLTYPVPTKASCSLPP